MNPLLILIGPIGAGKSTVGRLLAQRLALPGYSLDELRWAYYNEVGYDEAAVSELVQAEGWLGALRYWKPFEAHAVERVLADYAEGVIDFGAGHSVYEDEALFARVQRALAPCPHVILLLPSPDLDESTAIVNARIVRMLQEQGEVADEALFALNEQFVKHPSNHRLATMTVYTRDKTPEETADEIVQALGL